MKSMIINELRNFFDPSLFQINICAKNIYVNNYTEVVSLGLNKIVLKVIKAKIILNGTSFSLTKLANNELLITGKLESLEIKYE